MNRTNQIRSYIAHYTERAEEIESGASRASEAGLHETAAWRLSHAAGYRRSIARLQAKMAALEG